MLNVIFVFITVNALTYLLFYFDKRCARAGRWRVPEAALLGVSLLGGSPAAWCAMQRLRHKTRKPGFRMRYWMIVGLQAGILAYVALHTLAG